MFFTLTVKDHQLSLHQWNRITRRRDWVKSSVPMFFFLCYVIMKKTERKTQIRERKASIFSREKSYHISHWLAGFLYKQTWCDEIFQFSSAVRRRRKEKTSKEPWSQVWTVKSESSVKNFSSLSHGLSDSSVENPHCVCLVDGLENYNLRVY